MDSKKVLEVVAEEVVVCKLCDLQYSRKKAVPGEGPANASIMLIGEGPGFYENEQGRPFVGASGKFLSELLGNAGVKREDVFITNVVKCRPPNNRDPLPDEIHICVSNYLNRQMDAINPKVIVTLGRHSMGLFLPDAKISNVHGQSFWVRATDCPHVSPGCCTSPASAAPGFGERFCPASGVDRQSKRKTQSEWRQPGG